MASPELKYIISSEDKATGNINKVGSGFKKLGGVVAGFVGAAALIKFTKDSTKAFMVQENAEKQLEQRLISTKNAAGLTAQEIKNMASSFQKLTNYGDEVTLSGQNLLLTFDKIGKDIFPAATEIMLDMSTAMKTDLKSSALLVGKALQEPAKQARTLARSGIQFTDVQIKMMKNFEETGQLGKSQAIIMKELQKQFGGASRAARDTAEGGMMALKNSFGDMQETVGMVIMAVGRPIASMLQNITEAVNLFLGNTAQMADFANFVGTVAGVLAVAVEIITFLVDIAKELLDEVLGALGEGFNTVAGEGDGLSGSFDLLGGMLQAVSAGFAVGGKMVSGFITNIANLVNAVFKSIDVLGKFGEALLDPLNPKKWEAVAEAGKTAVDAFGKFGAGVIDSIAGVVNEVVGQVTGFFDDAAKTGEKTKKTFLKIQEQVTRGLKVEVKTVVEKIPPLKIEDKDIFLQIPEEAKKYLGMGAYGKGMGGAGIAPDTGETGAKKKRIEEQKEKEAQQLSAVMNTVQGGLGELGQSVMQNVTQFGVMGLVVSAVQEFLKGLVGEIGPELEEMLQMIASLLQDVGSIIGKILLPIIKLLSTVIYHIVNFLATIINFFIDFINFALGWAGVKIDKISVDKPGSKGGGMGGLTRAYVPINNMGGNQYTIIISPAGIIDPESSYRVAEKIRTVIEHIQRTGR